MKPATKKGHKYITVIVNHDTNTVVWAAPGHPKLDDAEAAAAKELKSWLWWASHSRIPVICNLARKIRRHQQHILNTIRPGLSNARIEAINNKIKRIIRKAYSFRNIDHMIDLIYLICSNLKLPLPDRKINAPQALLPRAFDRV